MTYTDGAGDTVNKPETSPVQRKKPFSGSDASRKKEFFKMRIRYGLFAASLKTLKTGRLDRALTSIEDWQQLLNVALRFARMCYKYSRDSLKAGQNAEARKWLSLSLRFLRAAIPTKKAAEDEKLVAKLEQLETQIKETMKLLKTEEQPA